MPEASPYCSASLLTSAIARLGRSAFPWALSYARFITATRSGSVCAERPGIVGLRRLIEFVSLHWQTVHRSLPLSLGQYFDAVLASGAAFGGALIGSLFLTGLISFIAAFVASAGRARWLRFSLFLLGAMFLTGSGWGNGTDFAKQFVAAAILLAVIVFAVRRLIRFNVLGYLLIAACVSLLGAAAPLLGQPDAFYRTNGYVLILLMVLLLGWPLSVWRIRASTGS